MAGADMAEADMAEETGWTAGSETGPGRRSPWGAAKRLNDRTPLRTKLITALLALVIMAIAAISVASGTPSAPARAYSVPSVGLRAPFSISESDPLPTCAAAASAPTERPRSCRAARNRSPTRRARSSTTTDCR